MKIQISLFRKPSCQRKQKQDRFGALELFSLPASTAFTPRARRTCVESDDADTQAAAQARSRDGCSVPPPPGVRRGSCWRTRLPRKPPPSRSGRPRRVEAAAFGLEKESLRRPRPVSDDRRGRTGGSSWVAFSQVYFLVCLEPGK